MTNSLLGYNHVAVVDVVKGVLEGSEVAVVDVDWGPEGGKVWIFLKSQLVYCIVSIV